MYKINKAHLLRVKLYINMLDEKAGASGLSLPDLKEEEKKIAWAEACKTVKQLTSVGFINENDRKFSIRGII